MTKPARWGAKRASGAGLDSRLDICADPEFATHCNDPLAEPISWSLWKGRHRTECIRVTISRYQGKPIVDVRVFFTTKSGHMQATKKGVAFAIAKLPELRKALEKAEIMALDLDLIEAVR
jgi:hypothetical protein